MDEDVFFDRKVGGCYLKHIALITTQMEKDFWKDAPLYTNMKYHKIMLVDSYYKQNLLDQLNEEWNKMCYSEI